jgi:hypothetical protein
MWFVILVCAAGVDCGIKNPVAKQVASEWDCREAGKLAIALAGYDQTKFKIICAKAAED